jgi:hypothetical protein
MIREVSAVWASCVAGGFASHPWLPGVSFKLAMVQEIGPMFKVDTLLRIFRDKK